MNLVTITMQETLKQEYYHALINKDPDYDGIFYVGVTSTGIFCRPTCPARKPKYENCEFYESAQEALLASFRPCQRCQPLSNPDTVPPLIKQLIDLVESTPEKRWKNEDLRALNIDESTARRQFQKRFNMTFIEYARARRMGLAMKEIRQGKTVIDAQLDSGYESSSGFRDAFTRIMGKAPGKIDCNHILKACWIDTPLGPMIAVANDDALYLLEFVSRRGLEREIERLRQRLKIGIVPGDTPILRQITHELENYFSGNYLDFHTPIHTLGTPFQQTVWHALQQIPIGETCSYLDLAQAVDNPKGCRAVAQANGANQLALIIPCHRVINKDGKIGGYGGGISRKQWLLEHERTHHQ